MCLSYFKLPRQPVRPVFFMLAVFILISLAGGYLFKFKSHILMPEVGLDYMYTHRQSFTTND